MKIKHYLFTILLPIFMIFAFSPVLAAENAEEPETKTETRIEASVKNEESTKYKEKLEKNEENIKIAEEKNIPQVMAETNSPTKETEKITEKNELKSEKIENKEKLKNEQPDQPKNKASNYVVEFIHNKLKYILPGDNSVKLSKILDKLEIAGNEITEVSSSNDSLFSATKESGEWVIDSHKAFHTNEHLYVTIDNIKYDIKAADYSLPGSKWDWYNSAKTIAITTDSVSQSGVAVYGYYYYETRILKLQGANEQALTGSAMLKDYRINNNANKSPMWNMCGDVNLSTGNYVNHIIMDDKITYIGNYFFYAVNRQSDSTSSPKNPFTIHLSTGLTNIGDYAFYDSGIKTLYLPESITHVSGNAFDSCTKLDNVLIPNLTSASSGSGTAVIFEQNIFNNTPNGMKIYLGTGMYNFDAYCRTDGYDSFPNNANQYFNWHGQKIGPTMYAFPEQPGGPPSRGYPGDKGYLAEYPTRTELVIVGYGAMNDYTTSSNSPITSNTPQVTSVTFNTVFGDNLVNDYDVGFTKIGNYAFYNCQNITTITLPADVSSSKLTTIGAGAFMNCSALSSIKQSGSANAFPTSVTAMSNYVFKGCTSLASFTVNASTTSIGTEAFYGCTALTTVNLPSNTLTSVGASAFQNCTSLTSIKPSGSSVNSFPTSVAVMSNYVFKGCTSLASFTVNASTTSIGTEVFRGCTALTTVNLPTGNTLTSIGQKAFQGCTSLTSIKPSGSSVNTFPNGITTISVDTFWDCQNLSSFTISSSVTTIYAGAFGRTGLTSITIPKTVTNIAGDEPTSTHTPQSDWGAFADCESLTSVTFEINRTSDLKIGQGAFYSCGNLTSVSFTDKIITIGVDAFKSCSKLTNVTIPTTISSGGLGANAFVNIKNKADVYYNGTESDFASKCSASSTQGVSNVANVFGYDVESDDTNSYIYHFPCGASLWYGVDAYQQKITITGSGAMWDYNMGNNSSPFNSHCSSGNTFTTIDMQGGTSIGTYAFYQCDSITSITFPSSGFTKISSGAFRECSSLQTIIFPASVTEIGEAAFRQCTALTTVKPSGSSVNTFPDAITTIPHDAFWMCTALPSFTISNCVTTIDYGSFNSCNALTSIEIPASVTSINTPSVAPNYIWGAFARCEKLTTITIASGSNNLTIGNGSFYSCTKATTVNIPSSITSMGDCAFVGLANNANIYYNGTESDFTGKCSASSTQGVSNVVNVFGYDIESTATNSYIYHFPCGANLWYGVDGANATITITGSGTMWDYGTSNNNKSPFNSHCSSGNTYTTIDMQDGTSIGRYAFYNCVSITTVTVPSSGLTAVENGAFEGCTNLANIKPANATTGPNTLPNTISDNTLHQSIFFKCSSLTSFTIPSNIETIGANAFRQDPAGSGLTSITIPSSVTTIESKAFQNITSLTTVTIPNSVTTIGNQAFYGCSGLTSVVIPTSISSAGLGASAFEGLANSADIYYSDTESALISACTSSDIETVFGTGNTIERTSATSYYYHFQCGDDLWYSLDSQTHTITITGSGPMWTYWVDNNPGQSAQYGLSPFNLHCSSGNTYTTIDMQGGTSIGTYAFYQCDSITSITFPSSGFTTISNGAFLQCSSLPAIVFPTSVNEIGEAAFRQCTALTTVKPSGSSVNTFPDAITTIPHDAFWMCSVLPSFTISNYVTTIDYGSFNSCNALTSIEIPASVTSINTPSVATNYIWGAFARCANLTTITIASGSNNLTIGNGSFYNCTSATTVNIPSRVTSMGTNAFAGLANNANIYYNGTESAFAGKCTTSVINVFGYDIAGTDANNYIYHFKCGQYAWYSLEYNTTTNYLQVNIYKDADAPSETTISTYDWDSSGTNCSPFYSHGSSPMNVNVDPGINYIGNSIFQNCAGLIGVYLPSTLNATGTNICENCTSLWGVYNLINTNLAVIQKGSFKNCQSLRQAVLPTPTPEKPAARLTVIDDEAFYGCTNLISDLTTIPSIVTTIGDSAFQNCSKLANITIPTGVTSVGDDAFAGLGTDSSVAQVHITYNGKEAALAAVCGGDEGDHTLIESFGYDTASTTQESYTFHFTQDIRYWSGSSQITPPSSPNSYQTASGTQITLPTLSDTQSQRFDGWYTDAQLTTPATTPFTPVKSGPYGDLDYYAKWVIIEKSIIYIVNGGNPLPNGTFQPETGDTITLSIPTKTGNAFLGWHFLSDLSDNAVGSFVADSSHNQDVTVYAEWYQRENIPYWANSSQTLLSSVEYEIIKPWETTLQGGTAQNPKWYVLNSDVSFDDRLIINGNVHLILKDGCTITSYDGISVNEGNSITIYAQDSDQNYINQDYSSVDELITKMNLQHIEMTNTFNGVTYGAEDSYYGEQIVNLSNGNVYTPDYDIDYGNGASYSDGSTTLVFGYSTWNDDERYFTVDGGVTKYYEYYDNTGDEDEDEDTKGQYYVTADGGVTKYYFVEDTIKYINTENKNDSFWTLDIEPSQDETGQYIVPCNDTTKYYIYHDSALNMDYVSADEGATKYYNAYQYTKWICNNHDADGVWIDPDDFHQNWTSLGQDYYLDTDTLKTYYQEYDDDKDLCSYYYETTDTERTHKYYETSLGSSRLFTDDIDTYNSRISSLKEPGRLFSCVSHIYANIGGDYKHINGNITIYGGTYKLTSGYGGAAIGTGSFKDAEDPAPPNNSTITIHGGNISIVPTSSDAGNAIGGGYNANGGNIIINGGRLELGYDYTGPTPEGNSYIGVGYGISAAEDTTTVRISWTNITDFVAIKLGTIRCSQLTFEDENGNPKKFVLAGENKLTENSYVTPEMIATMGDDSDFILIPYSEDIQYVLQIPARTVVPFRTTNRKLSYDPEHNSPTVSVQTKPDDESTPNVDESTPLVKPYQLALKISKINFRRITGTDAQDNPVFSDQDVIVYNLIDENNRSVVEFDKYFSSDSYDYDRYQPTDLGGSENAWISIESSQWQNLTPGIYQGLVTFDVGLATNGAKPGEVPFYFYYFLGG